MHMSKDVSKRMSKHMSIHMSIHMSERAWFPNHRYANKIIRDEFRNADDAKAVILRAFDRHFANQYSERGVHFIHMPQLQGDGQLTPPGSKSALISGVPNRL